MADKPVRTDPDKSAPIEFGKPKLVSEQQFNRPLRISAYSGYVIGRVSTTAKKIIEKAVEAAVSGVNDDAAKQAIANKFQYCTDDEFLIVCLNKLGINFQMAGMPAYFVTQSLLRPDNELEEKLLYWRERYAYLTGGWVQELNKRFRGLTNYGGGMAIVPKYKMDDGQTVATMKRRGFIEMGIVGNELVIVGEDKNGNDVWANPHQYWVQHEEADFYNTQRFKPLSPIEIGVEKQLAKMAEANKTADDKMLIKKYSTFNTFEGWPHKLEEGGFVTKTWNDDAGQLVDREILLARNDLPPEMRAWVRCGLMTPNNGAVPWMSFPRIHDYLLNLLCRGNWTYWWFLVRWIADLVQNPRRKYGKVAIVLRSLEEGTGKTKLFQMCQVLVGHAHAYLFPTPDTLTDKFATIEFVDRLVVCFDEAVMSVDPQARSRFNSLITGDELRVEEKNIRAHNIPNYIRVIICTNNEWAVPKSMTDRRSWALHVSDVHIRDKVYFTALDEAFAGTEMLAFFNFLASLDLVGFNPADERPETDEDTRQKAKSIFGTPRILMEILDRGRCDWIAVEGRIVTGVGTASEAAGAGFGSLVPLSQWDDRLLKGGQALECARYFVESRLLRELCRAEESRFNMSSRSFGIGVMNVLAQPGTGTQFTGTKAWEEIWEKVKAGQRYEGRWWPELWVARRLWELRFNGGNGWEWSNDLREWLD